jgi:uncharacterized membrane protein YfcA
VAGTGYLIAGEVNASMLGSMLLGSVPAVIVGSLIARVASPRWLQVALALVLLVAAAKSIGS